MNVYIVFSVADEACGDDAPYAGIFDDLEKAERVIDRARQVYPCNNSAAQPELDGGSRRMRCPLCNHPTGHEVGCDIGGADKGALVFIISELARKVSVLETVVFDLYTGQTLNMEEKNLIDDIVEDHA